MKMSTAMRKSPDRTSPWTKITAYPNQRVTIRPKSDRRVLDTSEAERLLGTVLSMVTDAMRVAEAFSEIPASDWSRFCDDNWMRETKVIYS